MIKNYLIIALCTILFHKSYSQTNITLKNSHTEYIIESPEELTISESYELIIHNQGGSRYSIVGDYTDQFKKIKKIKVEVFDQYGDRVKKLNKSDAIEYNFSSSYEINDSKIVYLNPEYANYPYTVKVELESEFDGFMALPEWDPQHAYNMKVEQASLRLIYPEGQQIKLFEHNISKTGERSEDGQKIVEYEVKDLEVVSENINIKKFIEITPLVRMSPLHFELDGEKGSFESWKTFGNWFLDLNEGRDSLLNDTKNFLDSLKVLEAKEQIAEIYHYMQDRTRYISIQLGIGGFKSIPSHEVENSGYGDCKALTNYMKAMLKYNNIPSNYILVRAGRNTPNIEKGFPSNQFNHVFLGVPLQSDTVMLECTSNILPPDYIGSFTDDRDVLWIDSNKSEIIHTKVYEADENLMQIKGKIVLDKDGNMNIQATEKKAGIFLSDLMYYKSYPQKSLEQKANAFFDYDDFNLNNLSYEHPNRDVKTFNVNYDLSINHAGKSVEGKLLIPSNLWVSIEKYLNIDHYSSSVDIRRGFVLENDFEIQAPDQYWLDQLPERKSFENDFGSYSLEIIDNEGKFTIKRTVKINKGFYQESNYDDFKSFIRQIKRADNSKLVLNSNT